MKKVFSFVLISIVVLGFKANINAYVVDSNNNPGGTSGIISGNGLSGADADWISIIGKGNQLEVVRVRIFRDGQVINGMDKYYSLSNPDKKTCYTELKSTVFCSTSGYNYSTVTTSENVTCTEELVNIKFGCIAGTDLGNSWGIEDGKYISNGSYLEEYLTTDSYKNLKDLLQTMGYDDSNYKNQDIVIIEPATVVKCNGKKYFGTSTALMKKDVSYRRSSGGLKCAADDRGWYFQLAFRAMSQALSQNGDKKVVDNNYTGFGYFKYDVSGLGYTPKGKLVIEKVDQNGGEIVGKSVTFGIYTDSLCTNSLTTFTFNTEEKGELQLESGNYFLRETQAPTAYTADNTCYPFSITNGEETFLQIQNAQTCSADFKSKVAGGLTVEERFQLFETWEMRNLLNFEYDTEAEADLACSTFEYSPTLTSGCISGGLSTNFSSTNLSNYDEYFEIDGEKVFCSVTFSISNEIENPFPTTKAGMLILKRDEDNKTIATGTITRTCYTLYDGYSLGAEDDKSYSDYIDEEKLSLSIDDDSTNQISVTYNDPESETDSLDSGLNEYVIKYSADYDLIKWHSKLGSGEIVSESCNNCRSLGYGIYSRLINNGTNNNSLNSLYNGNVYFSYKYKGIPSDNGICTYSVENEIIIPGPEDNNKLNIEFRIFQVNNPFPGKTGEGRIVGSNWCYGDDCSSSNDLINNIMYNRNDSYNKKNSEPLYRIELTPSVISEIRNYNKTKNYDDDTLYFDDYNNKRKSDFLDKLETDCLGLGLDCFVRTTIDNIEWLQDYEEI